MSDLCVRKETSNKMLIREFEIPVPWGHVAVKAWGDQSKTPVLAVHGISDNAASFDKLLPLLPESFYYMCIDLPSHGKSTSFPPHSFIAGLDYILTLKLVLNYINREKYIFLGHSYGGQLLIMFTQIYPKHVLKLITLDSFYIPPVVPEIFTNVVEDYMQLMLNISKNINSKNSYLLEDAVTKIRVNRLFATELDKESAAALAQRSLRSVEGDKYNFTSDSRLKAIINPFFDLDYITKLLKKYQITCPFLFIYSKNTMENYQEYCVPMLDCFRRMRNCQIEETTGCHDVHINYPKIVSPMICKFLMSAECKL